jgi:hypothetical protein
MNKNIPLIVDLDHTLIDTDLLVESSIATLKKSPWLVALYPNSGSESFSCISPISTSAFSIFSGSVVSSCCCL